MSDETEAPPGWRMHEPDFLLAHPGFPNPSCGRAGAQGVRLQDAWAITRAETQPLVDEIERLRSRLTTVEREMDEARERSRAAQGGWDNASCIIDDLRTALAEREADIEKLRRSVDALHDERDQREAECEDLRVMREDAVAEAERERAARVDAWRDRDAAIATAEARGRAEGEAERKRLREGLLFAREVVERARRLGITGTSHTARIDAALSTKAAAEGSTNIEEMRENYDWQEAFAYADKPEPVVGDTKTSMAGFGIADVAHVEACSEGENDGPEWLMVGRLIDGRWFYLAAGCDYTGWD